MAFNRIKSSRLCRMDGFNQRQISPEKTKIGGKSSQAVKS
jgi:hypothetical protein